jgi:asparagine synthetase A
MAAQLKPQHLNSAPRYRISHKNGKYGHEQLILRDRDEFIYSAFVLQPDWIRIIKSGSNFNLTGV